MNTGEDRKLNREENIIWEYWEKVIGMSEEEINTMSDDEFHSISLNGAKEALGHE